VLISHKRIDRSPDAEILYMSLSFGKSEVNSHVIFREGYFVDCSSVSFCFTVPNGQNNLETVNVEDLYRPIYLSARDIEWRNEERD
jgi:hypothetical protein